MHRYTNSRVNNLVQQQQQQMENRWWPGTTQTKPKRQAMSMFMTDSQKVAQLFENIFDKMEVKE